VALAAYWTATADGDETPAFALTIGAAVLAALWVAPVLVAWLGAKLARELRHLLD
jgi:hypothetical protein